MRQIYFLILNYCTKEETIKCVQTIKELKGVRYKISIVIVDNDSNDNSYEELRNIYKCDKTIILCQTEFNMGFSRGNNFGYQLIKREKDADFIIVCNSDIEFRQKDFLTRMLEEYEMSKFHLCGPDVYCESDLNKGWKGHQAPAYPWESKYWFVKQGIWYNALKLQYYENEKIANFIQYCMGWGIMKLFEGFIRILMKTKYKNYRVHRQENIPLHGSCLIISREFIEREEKIFTPETEFYGEELLLYLKQQRKEYRSVYTPTLRVWHMQGRATSKEREKKKFICKNLKNSAEIFLNEINTKSCGRNGKINE